MEEISTRIYTGCNITTDKYGKFASTRSDLSALALSLWATRSVWADSFPFTILSTLALSLREVRWKILLR